MKGRKLRDLTPADYNPRKINDWALAALESSMQAFGDLSGVVVNRRTGNVVGGHQRLKHLPADLDIQILEALDEPNEQGTVAYGAVDWRGEKWHYREVDVDPETEVAMNLAANQHGGVFDVPKLSELLQQLEADGFDMDLLGFDQDELSDMLKTSGEVIPTDMPELPTEDRDPFQRVTFTLHDEQAELIERALGHERRETLYRFTNWMKDQNLSAAKLNEVTETFMGSHYITTASQPAIPTREIWQKIRPLLTEVPGWVEEMIDREDGVGNENARGNSLTRICRHFLGESDDS